jgi:hypothetical protein
VLFENSFRINTNALIILKVAYGLLNLVFVDIGNPECFYGL